MFKDISPSGRLVWLHSFADEAGQLTRHPLSPTWPLTLLSTVAFDDAHPGHTLVTVSRRAGGRVGIDAVDFIGSRHAGRNVRKSPEIRVFAPKYGLFLKPRPDG